MARTARTVAHHVEIRRGGLVGEDEGVADIPSGQGFGRGGNGEACAAIVIARDQAVAN